jgi:large exoprotein involved in heme utilization and adhesion
VQLDQGAAVSAKSSAAGYSGNISVDANTITMAGVGSGSDEAVNFTGFRSDTVDGTGGNIGVTANTLSMSNGAEIASGSSGAGTGGDIGITAGLVQLDQGAAVSAKSSAAGYSGNISVDANRVAMEGVGSGSDEAVNFTGFRSDTVDGTGGNIGVRTDTLSMSNGAAIMSGSSGAGTGGDIAINGGVVLLNGRALVSARSNGSGDAGNVAFNVASLISESATISTEARLTDGGNIAVKAWDLVYLLNSQMTASVGGGASTVGGNITIDSDHVVLNGSSIVANAYEGHGGNIGIAANVFLASSESVVSASSQLGIDGTVDVRAPVTSVSSNPAPVRGGYLQSADVLRDRCVARIQGGGQSSLTVSGRDGLPPRPGNVLPAPLF